MTIAEDALAIWKKKAIEVEGCKNVVYLDSRGLETVGIGHLCTPADGLKLGQQISAQRIDQLFTQDTKTALETALKQFYAIGIETAEWLAALINVNFQLGNFSKKFPNSYALLINHKFDMVIQNIINSVWFKQTPRRANDFINAIRELKG